MVRRRDALDWVPAFAGWTEAAEKRDVEKDGRAAKDEARTVEKDDGRAAANDGRAAAKEDGRAPPPNPRAKAEASVETRHELPSAASAVTARTDVRVMMVISR
ncbi:MAG TPA: hypothetical protein VLJ17_21955 [Xanthobacteraceae bacterium]|nr:hypothetical protein [Xanthobacteraceae bacterium]